MDDLQLIQDIVRDLAGPDGRASRDAVVVALDVTHRGAAELVAAAVALGAVSAHKGRTGGLSLARLDHTPGLHALTALAEAGEMRADDLAALGMRRPLLTALRRMGLVSTDCGWWSATAEARALIDGVLS